MKRNFIIISMIMSLMLLPLLANADVSTNLSLNDKADVLNKLTLLQGNGNDYNLNGQLKRSEAITFIIRLMGKTSEVINNSERYKVNTFKDVKTSDWFAPYVGFAKEIGIVSGYPDGGYHPNDSVSEKAFLNLVLGAIGYKANKDFVWNTIYASGFNIGLVSETKYQKQTEDNNKYLRSDVVNVLYNSLLKPMKDSKKTIIDNLIDQKIITKDIAIELGLAPKPISTTIVSNQVVNSVTVNVYLNQNVQTLTNQDITIYETDNKANKLTASIKSQIDRNLVITTSTQLPDKNYTIEINGKDELTSTAALASINFKGYKIPEIQSNFFKISKIVPVSKSIVNVYFTQPVFANTAIPIYYEILKNNNSFIKGSFSNLSAKTLSDQNNVVSLNLKNNDIVEDALYSLKISGDISSAYGVRLNDGAGDTGTFTSNSLDNDVFKVVGINPVDSKTIKLEFNREIDLLSAKQLGNYQITTTSGVPVGVIRSSVPNDGTGKVILLGIAGTLSKNLNYQIVVKNVDDVYTLTRLAETAYPFAGAGIPDHKDLQISFVTALDKSTLKVYFDRNLDPSAAINTVYYSVLGISDPSFVGIPSQIIYDPKDPASIKLLLPTGKEVISPSIYKLRVLNFMLDELGNTSTANSESTSFTGSGVANIKPQITNALVIGKDTVKVTTQTEILASGINANISNYSLETKDGSNTVIIKTPISINFIDSTTFVLRFDSLDLSKDYVLKFTSLTDISGLNSRTINDGGTSITVPKSS